MKKRSLLVLVVMVMTIFFSIGIESTMADDSVELFFPVVGEPRFFDGEWRVTFEKGGENETLKLEPEEIAEGYVKVSVEKAYLDDVDQVAWVLLLELYGEDSEYGGNAIMASLAGRYIDLLKSPDGLSVVTIEASHEVSDLRIVVAEEAEDIFDKQYEYSLQLVGKDGWSLDGRGLQNFWVAVPKDVGVTIHCTFAGDSVEKAEFSINPTDPAEAQQ